MKRLLITLAILAATGALAASSASADYGGDPSGLDPTCNSGSDGQYATVVDLSVGTYDPLNNTMTANYSWKQHCHHAQSVEAEVQYSYDNGAHWTDTQYKLPGYPLSINDHLYGTSSSEADTLVTKSDGTLISCFGDGALYRLRVWTANQAHSTTVPIVSPDPNC